MGLDIHSPNKHYSWGYSALHRVRWLALVSVGFPEKVGGEGSWNVWPTCYVVPPGIRGDEINQMTLALQIAGHHYPNLLLHQDCDGEYTRRGKVDTGSLATGNSVKLLEELRVLSRSLDKRFKEGRDWDIFQSLYEVVEDAVKNGNGRLEFR